MDNNNQSFQPQEAAPQLSLLSRAKSQVLLPDFPVQDLDLDGDFGGDGFLTSRQETEGKDIELPPLKLMNEPQHSSICKERLSMKISAPLPCLSCGESLEYLLSSAGSKVIQERTPTPPSEIEEQRVFCGNCQDCGNFVVVLRKNRSCPQFEVISQALKEESMRFRPEVSSLSILRVLTRFSKLEALASAQECRLDFNDQAKYLKFRNKNIKDLFQTSERFGFKNQTIHLAIALYDSVMNRQPNQIELFRDNFASCKGVISEQICTFIACVALQLSAKYLEIKYPVVEDVCHLMQSPFTFDEFIEMEQVLLEQFFDWDLCQIVTLPEVLETLLSQGVIFSSDAFTSSNPDRSPKDFLDLSKEDRVKLIKKVRTLAETFFPNLLVYQADLCLANRPLFLAVAIIIEARRSAGVEVLWPMELDLLVFGQPVSDIQEYSNPKLESCFRLKLIIFDVFLKIQIQVHKELKLSKKKISHTPSQFCKVAEDLIRQYNGSLSAKKENPSLALLPQYTPIQSTLEEAKEEVAIPVQEQEDPPKAPAEYQTSSQQIEQQFFSTDRPSSIEQEQMPHIPDTEAKYKSQNLHQVNYGVLTTLESERSTDITNQANDKPKPSLCTSEVPPQSSTVKKELPTHPDKSQYATVQKEAISSTRMDVIQQLRLPEEESDSPPKEEQVQLKANYATVEVPQVKPETARVAIPKAPRVPPLTKRNSGLAAFKLSSTALNLASVKPKVSTFRGNRTSLTRNQSPGNQSLDRSKKERNNSTVEFRTNNPADQSNRPIPSYRYNPTQRTLQRIGETYKSVDKERPREASMFERMVNQRIQDQKVDHLLIKKKRDIQPVSFRQPKLKIKSKSRLSEGRQSTSRGKTPQEGRTASRTSRLSEGSKSGLQKGSLLRKNSFLKNSMLLMKEKPAPETCRVGSSKNQTASRMKPQLSTSRFSSRGSLTARASNLTTTAKMPPLSKIQTSSTKVTNLVNSLARQISEQNKEDPPKPFQRHHSNTSLRMSKIKKQSSIVVSNGVSSKTRNMAAATASILKRPLSRAKLDRPGSSIPENPFYSVRTSVMKEEPEKQQSEGNISNSTNSLSSHPIHFKTQQIQQHFGQEQGGEVKNELQTASAKVNPFSGRKSSQVYPQAPNQRAPLYRTRTNSILSSSQMGGNQRLSVISEAKKSTVARPPHVSKLPPSSKGAYVTSSKLPLPKPATHKANQMSYTALPKGPSMKINIGAPAQQTKGRRSSIIGGDKPMTTRAQQQGITPAFLLGQR